MSKREKIRFVKELSKKIAQHIENDIIIGKVPDSWEGHELRALLAAKHIDSASMSRRVMTGRRKREFNNHCLVANL